VSSKPAPAVHHQLVDDLCDTPNSIIAVPTINRPYIRGGLPILWHRNKIWPTSFNRLPIFTNGIQHCRQRCSDMRWPPGASLGMIENIFNRKRFPRRSKRCVCIASRKSEARRAWTLVAGTAEVASQIAQDFHRRSSSLEKLTPFCP
jgi:hypothetical protein